MKRGCLHFVCIMKDVFVSISVSSWKPNNLLSLSLSVSHSRFLLPLPKSQQYVTRLPSAHISSWKSFLFQVICQNGGTVVTKTDSCICAEPYYGERCEKILRGMAGEIFPILCIFVSICSLSGVIKKKKKKKKKEAVLSKTCVFFVW